MGCDVSLSGVCDVGNAMNYEETNKRVWNYLINLQNGFMQVAQMSKEIEDSFLDRADKAYQEEKDYLAEGRMEQEKLENGEINYED